MAIVVSHNEIISKERIIVTYHPIGKKKNIYSLFCLKKSGGYSTMSEGRQQMLLKTAAVMIELRLASVTCSQKAFLCDGFLLVQN